MNRIKRFFKLLGPGFITGASDDDPSGIATYSMTGAMFGLSQLWLALFCFPLMVAVQEMCGRIGIATGKGLASVIKQHYSLVILYACVFLLLVANVINIGANLGAMAASAKLIIPLPFYLLLVVVTLVSLLLQVFIPYRTYVGYLKYLAFTLLAYIAAAFVVHPDWLRVLVVTFVPKFSFSKEYLVNVVAFLGTSISPYLFFWQTSEEVEEEVSHHRLRVMGVGNPKVYPRDISRLRQDTIIGMFFSQLVAWFIIITTGSTLYTAGIHEINSAAEAALALKPLAGDYAFFLFALGIISTGLLAVPVLAGSASYAVSEVFGWKEGLYRKVQKARAFYAVIAAAMVFGLVINFTAINPFSALYYSAVVNGLIAPPLLVMIFIIANNKKIMGHRVNPKGVNIFGILTIIIMSVAAIGLLLIL